MAEQLELQPVMAAGWDDWDQGRNMAAVASFGLLAPAAAVTAESVRFLDVSHWQNDRGRIDYARVAKAGYVAVVAKLTEGTGFTDKWGVWNIQEAARHGMVAGGYHFLRKDSSARNQFEHFLRRLKEAGPLGGRIVALDVETAGNGSDAGYELADQWAQMCKAELGVLPWAYYPRWHMNKMGQCPTVHGPWWQSAFGPSPGQPMCGFPRIAAWQHSSTGAVPGINGHVDLNRWFGDLASLKATTIGGGGNEEDDMPLTDQDKTDIRTIVASEVQQLLRSAFGGVHPGATSETVRGSQDWLFKQAAGQASRLQAIEDQLATLAPTLGDPQAAARANADELAARLAPRP